MNFALGILAGIWLVTVAAAGYGIRVIWERELIAAAKRAEEHHATIQRLHEFYREALKQIGNTVHLGTPTPPKAEIATIADAELTMRGAIHEDVINNGMTHLRREYEAAGLHPSDDELREEVESLVLGHDTSARLYVRDGA